MGLFLQVEKTMLYVTAFLSTCTQKAHLVVVPYSANPRNEQLPPDDNVLCSYDKQYFVMQALEAKFSSILVKALQNVTTAN